MNILEEVFHKEIQSIKLLQSHLSDESYCSAIHLIERCKGKVIVTGVGKSGHIASKIAATMASTGTPAFFVHPSEACHGDLGMVEPKDIVLAISHSGESSEILTILPICKTKGTKIISMTSNSNSSMAKISDIHLNTYVTEEAGPLNLAPTCSTTTSLVLGDALAIALSKNRNFTQKDFASGHPGGALGRKLFLLNENIMHVGDQIPIVRANQNIIETIIEITEKKLGFAVVVNSQNYRLLGIFTDGDLRRILSSNIDLKKTTISEIVHTNCITVKPKQLAWESLQIMSNHGISGLVVVDNKQNIIGAFNIHDLINAGINDGS